MSRWAAWHVRLCSIWILTLFFFNMLTLQLQEHKHPDIWGVQITFLWCFCVFPRGENGMSAVFMQLPCPSGSHSALMVYLHRFQAKRFHVAVFVQKLVSPGFWMRARQQNKSRSFSWINQPTRGSFCITEFTHLHLFFMHAAERKKKRDRYSRNRIITGQRAKHAERTEQNVNIHVPYTCRRNKVCFCNT